MISYYVISNILQLWLFPPGINIFFGLIGLCLWKKHKKFSRQLIGFSFALLWFLSMPCVAQMMIDHLQNQYAPLKVNNIGRIDTKHAAIVILGGGVVKNCEFDHPYCGSSSTIDRALYGAYLYKKLHLPILVSGGSSFRIPTTVSEVMKEFMQSSLGVPVSFEDRDANTTKEEGLVISDILVKHNITTIYLVTDAWHMPRSIYAFRNSNLKVIPAPTRYISFSFARFPMNIFPSASALKASVVALHEYVGFYYYKIV